MSNTQLATTGDDRLYAMLLYLLSLFFPILAPLLIWLLKGEESVFVDHHGKQYFNFAISYFIYGIIGSVLIIVLIGLVLLPILGLMAFVFTIVAAVKAYQGDWHRFPLVITFLK